MAMELGNRIRELRLEHPLYKSLRQFADKLGKSPSWVSKVERNAEKPGRETLVDIARLLGADVDELFQLADQLAPDVEKSLVAQGPQVSGLLRTLSGLSTQQLKELEDKALAMKRQGPDASMCDGSRDDLHMANAAICFATSLRVPWLHDSDIEWAANTLLEEFASDQKEVGLEKVCPPLSPTNLVFDFLDPKQHLSLDIEIDLGCDDNGHPIAGLIRVADASGDGGEIFIDRTVAQTPLFAFTLAHEIGHWILHRRSIVSAREQLSLFDERPVQTQTLHRNLQGSQGKLPPGEWQANRFAAHLLMPADLVRSEFLARYGGPLNYSAQRDSNSSAGRFYANKRFYSRHIAEQTLYKDHCQLDSLYKLFGVSCSAMAIRLEELGLIVDDSHNQNSRLALA